MAYFDRVQETSATAGTGSLALAGASAGYVTFSSVYAVNNLVEYAIVDSTANAWEVGVGYLSGSTTLVRDRVLASSNSGALVSLAGNASTVVFATYSGVTAADNGYSVALRMGLFGV